MKPIEGAETGGAVGFFKGVGKGLVGFVITPRYSGKSIAYRLCSSSAVTKPVVGVFDLASNVTEGEWILSSHNVALLETHYRYP